MKACPEHGPDACWWLTMSSIRRAREVFIKKPEMPDHFNTPVKWGCPYDCGLCSDHEQHSCLTLLESVTSATCAARCATRAADPSASSSGRSTRSRGCSTQSSPQRGPARRRANLGRGADAAPGVSPRARHVQGAAHPSPDAEHRRRADREERRQPGGSRATCPTSRSTCSSTRSRKAPLREMRGEDMREVHEQALARLNALGISTTLVVTLKRGVNDHEIGRSSTSR